MSSKSVTFLIVHLLTFCFYYDAKVDASFTFSPPFSLGLGELFSSPDFRRIADVPLFVSSIQHQSALDLAEDGVEASAVTSVVMSRSISTFSLNRPFVFLIIEDTTGVPLFIGSIQNPDPSAPKQRKEQQDLPDEKLGAYNSLPK